MAKKRAIQLFKAGKQTDSAGSTHDFSTSTVAAIAANFDPAKAPAPVVVGHPSDNAPAYGWCEALSFNAETGLLDARLDLCDEMDAAVGAKHYTRCSAAFFPPAHPSNPKPGEFYLRHVGFLGGAAPAVPGLAPFGFADAGKTGPMLTVEFALNDGADKTLVQRIAEALAPLLGKDPAVVPAPTFSFDPTYTAPRASEPQTMMTDAEKAALQTANDKITSLEKQIRDNATAGFAAAASAFADGLITAKKLDPARKAEVVATYTAMAALPAIEFAAADGTTVKQSPLENWKKTLDGAAPVIETKEKIPADGTRKPVAAAAFTAPQGVGVEPDAAETNNKVVAYMSKSGEKNYAVALQLVLAGNTA